MTNVFRRPVDVPAVAWWSERAVPALLAVEVAVSVLPTPGIVPLAITLAVSVLAFTTMMRLSLTAAQLFPERGRALAAARESGLGRRLREGGYVEPGERARAGRIAWSALVTSTVSCWASLIFAGAAVAALSDEPIGSAEGAVGVTVLVGGLGMLAYQIRDSTCWRRIAADRFAVRAPAMS